MGHHHWRYSSAWHRRVFKTLGWFSLCQVVHKILPFVSHPISIFLPNLVSVPNAIWLLLAVSVQWSDFWALIMVPSLSNSFEHPEERGKFSYSDKLLEIYFILIVCLQTQPKLQNLVTYKLVECGLRTFIYLFIFARRFKSRFGWQHLKNWEVLCKNPGSCILLKNLEDVVTLAACSFLVIISGSSRAAMSSV